MTPDEFFRLQDGGGMSMSIFEKDNFDFLDKQTRQILLASRESFVPHTPYRYEKDMLEAVRLGDLVLARKCMEILDKTGQSGKLSPNPSVRLRSCLFPISPKLPEPLWTEGWKKIWPMP